MYKTVTSFAAANIISFNAVN